MMRSRSSKIFARLFCKQIQTWLLQASEDSSSMQDMHFILPRLAKNVTLWFSPVLGTSTAILNVKSVASMLWLSSVTTNITSVCDVSKGSRMCMTAGFTCLNSGLQSSSRHWATDIFCSRIYSH